VFSCMKLTTHLPPLAGLPCLDEASEPVPRPSGRLQEATGEKARRLFEELHLFRKPRYPPWRVVAYEPAQHVIVILVILYLLPVAGRPVKRVTGKPLFRQALEMLRLWFANRVDPPTYYQQELYESDRLPLASGYLTRFATKNGLFSRLNRM
jgi:hypothetical protein